MDQNTYIEQAAAHFRALLTEQLNRQARMAQGSPAKDFSRMERIVIGLIPGDGIGPILMAQARREKKYNSYLKSVNGYASSLKACTHLYDDGVKIFITLAKLKAAIANNPQGIVASMSMNNLYIETATELVSVFNLLNDAVAKGGTENMLTGADRSKTLWELNDKLTAFQKKLNKLYLSIRYYTMSDVWNNVTAGMIDRSNGEIATQALGRWRRAARVSTP